MTGPDEHPGIPDPTRREPADRLASEPVQSTTRAEHHEPAVQDVAAAGTEATPVETRTEGWSRLARMGRPRLTKANLLATVLAVALGFGVMTQVQQQHTTGLASMSQADLIALLDSVNARSGKLNTEIDTLTRLRDSLKTGGDAAALKAAQDRLTTLQILAGTIPVQGPGITMTITDPQKSVASSNILDAVEELRDAGAEAIQIGPVRVVASTWFALSDQNTLIVDGTTLKPPYVVKAIGDSHTMSTAMAIPGGVVESLRQLGSTATITSANVIQVTALRASSQPRYAQPDKAAG
ncbi:DUF881 domain-containing protein [Calidifontibacter sp. DB0510]|uniref:DUF881 domain-containing protein n=1 Tax=Metallococcus carri TaxID=1656884 RepID=A0A967E9C1_9MICO|nr:DUF881 domain-containing protein [Metallococcus carri]NHN54709.1 DUF881 domain-containing protein [Metallococcus carri]NOP37054.1 DUF881 domain-containing protein [Calidifontibacter sp. DB2511S]